MANYTGRQINGGEFMELRAYNHDWGWVRKEPTRPALFYIKSKEYYKVCVRIAGKQAVFLSCGATSARIQVYEPTDAYTPTQHKIKSIQGRR